MIDQFEKFFNKDKKSIKYFNELPVLIENDELFLNSCKIMWEKFLASSKEEISSIKHTLDNQDLLDSTRKRLSFYRQQKIKEQKEIEKYLSDFKKFNDESSAAFDAFNVDKPLMHNLINYSPNIFRDWVWGEEENVKSFELVKNVIGEMKGQSCLVLGVGAGKLLFDLANYYTDTLFLGIDQNPLLLTVAKNMLKNIDMELTEFPFAPIDEKHIGINHLLKNKMKLKGKVLLALDNGIDPNLTKGSFDKIILPWFVDIIPTKISLFLPWIQTYLKPEGEIIYFGSLQPNAHQIEEMFQMDEVIDLLESKVHMKLINRMREEIPYLKSPYSATNRLEKVECLKFKKQKEIDSELKKPEVWPKWIYKLDEPVPRMNLFENEQIIHLMQGEICGLIDGTRSINEIVSVLVGKTGYDKQEMQALLIQYLQKLLLNYNYLA